MHVLSLFGGAHLAIHIDLLCLLNTLTLYVPHWRNKLTNKINVATLTMITLHHNQYSKTKLLNCTGIVKTAT